jgi:hypothetical protein
VLNLLVTFGHVRLHAAICTTQRSTITYLQSASNYLFCFIRSDAFRDARSRSPPRQRIELSRFALTHPLPVDICAPAADIRNSVAGLRAVALEANKQSYPEGSHRRII